MITLAHLYLIMGSYVYSWAILDITNKQFTNPDHEMKRSSRFRLFIGMLFAVIIWPVLLFKLLDKEDK